MAHQLVKPLLEVRDLSVSIRGHVAVDRLSYTIARGETLGVVGESGCGKTLAALTLLGLAPPVAQVGGQALFNGRDLLALAEPELEQVRGAQIAMIFQEPMTALNPVLTVGEQVAEMFILHHGLTRRQAQRLAVDALARVHIADAYHCGCHYPHQLSGGQRQRAMIAMALACGPQLLIADEPTTALDVTVQAQILDLILELQEELGMAVLFISHNLGVISQVADRVMVMYAGQVVETAPNEVLLHEPLHPYTKALLATLPRLGERREKLPAIPGTVPPLGAKLQGCPFAGRCRFSDDRCRIEEPALHYQGSSHQVACLKVGAQRSYSSRSALVAASSTVMAT
jgi:peptide/nickel transport system ATP-binding protein/oligopeptide transport system ATP-binding protein